MLDWLRRGRSAARRHLAEGAALEAQGRLAEAKRAYDAALAAEPENSHTRFHLGRLA
jgi:hypothetical protein